MRSIFLPLKLKVTFLSLCNTLSPGITKVSEPKLSQQLTPLEAAPAPVSSRRVGGRGARSRAELSEMLPTVIKLPRLCLNSSMQTKAVHRFFPELAFCLPQVTCPWLHQQQQSICYAQRKKEKKQKKTEKYKIPPIHGRKLLILSFT